MARSVCSTKKNICALQKFFQVFLILICVILEVTLGGDPQVYENQDEDVQLRPNTRVARDHLKNSRSKLYQPQSFNFQKTLQQDQRQFRYAQQQRVDMENILKRKKEEPRRKQVIRASASTKKENYTLPGEKTNTTSLYSMWSKISQLSAKKSNRKLKPSSYASIDRGIKRQDNSQIVYTKRSEKDLDALNALVGQPPQNQLEGLKNLLESSQSSFVLPGMIKGPLPPSTITDSNITLEPLKFELDESAKAQLAKALADAQQQALAHVEAQHKAIQKAQVEAQKAALAQIQQHNYKFKSESLPKPLHLKQERPPTIQLNHQQVQIKPSSQPIKIIQPIPTAVYVTSPTSRIQEELVKSQTKTSLQKVTKLIPAKQSLKTYPEVVVETQNLPQVHDYSEGAYNVSKLSKSSFSRNKRELNNTDPDYDSFEDEDQNFDNSTLLIVSHSNSTAEPLRRYRKRKHKFHRNHSPRYHPVHYIPKPLHPVQEKSKFKFLDSVNQILPINKDQGSANYIIINNSNDHVNGGSSSFPTHPNFAHHPKFENNKHRVRVYHKPNIKKLFKIQNKVELAIKKVYERG